MATQGKPQGQGQGSAGDPPDDVDPTATEPVEPPEEDSWQPPTEAEWMAQQAKLTRIIAEGKKWQDSAKKAKQDADAATQTTAEQASAQAQAADKRFMRAEIRAALLAAGAQPDHLPRITRLVNVDALSIEDDSVLGLDGEIDSVKAEFPELFVQQRASKRERQGSVDQGTNGAGAASKPKTFAELAIEKAMKATGGKLS